MKNKLILSALCAICVLCGQSSRADGLAPTHDEIVQHRAVILLAQNTAPTGPVDPLGVATNILNTVPQANSYSNSTILVDIGLSSVGIGQTGVEETYLRGTYSLKPAIAVGVEGDFGAANVLDEAYGVFEVRKLLGDNAMIYGVAAVGATFISSTQTSIHNASLQGFIGAGTRVVPFSTAAPSLATIVEADEVIDRVAHTTIKGALGWRF